MLPAVLAALFVAGCAHEQKATDADVRGIGYVRLDDVVKKHPLYTRLSQIQDAIDALDLKSLGASAVPRSSAQIAQQTRELNQELQQAQNRASAILRQKQVDYARREQAAIDAALGSAASGTNGNQALTQMQTTTAQQAQAVTSEANADFQNYRTTVVAQDNAAVAQISRQLQLRAEQSFRQKATELNEQESQLALNLSQQDASKKLDLQTKLNNLAMDDATRAQYRNQLKRNSRARKRCSRCAAPARSTNPCGISQAARLHNAARYRRPGGKDSQSNRREDLLAPERSLAAGFLADCKACGRRRFHPICRLRLAIGSRRSTNSSSRSFKPTRKRRSRSIKPRRTTWTRSIRRCREPLPWRRAQRPNSLPTFSTSATICTARWSIRSQTTRTPRRQSAV